MKWTDETKKRQEKTEFLVRVIENVVIRSSWKFPVEPISSIKKIFFLLFLFFAIGLFTNRTR